MIHCIGIGPGDPDYLTLKGHRLISEADVVAGFDAVVDIIRPFIKPSAEIITMGYKDQPAQLAKVADRHAKARSCVVVFMGDLHFSGFQLLERVEHACGHSVPAVPGISSAQLMAEATRTCFDETTFLTFHRRGDIEPFKAHLASLLKQGRNAIIIPRPWDFMPHHIAAWLLENSVNPDLVLEVAENLSSRDARWTGTLATCPDHFSDMCIMLIRGGPAFPSQIDFTK